MARRAANLAELIEFPKLSRTSTGQLYRPSPTKLRAREPEWVASLMEDHSEWTDAVELPPIVRYDLEYQICSADFKKHAKLIGLPRIDAVAYHEDGISLIEAKLKCSPVDMLGGIAQLLHYKTMLRAIEGREVKCLVLACPSFPAFLVETLAEHKLPVRILKVTESSYIGRVP